MERPTRLAQFHNHDEGGTYIESGARTIQGHKIIRGNFWVDQTLRKGLLSWDFNFMATGPLPKRGQKYGNQQTCRYE